MPETARLPFPALIDSTIRADFAACPHKCFFAYVKNLRLKSSNIHLHFGGCFAHGLEIFRLAYYGDNLGYSESFARGCKAIIIEWGDFEGPSGHNKSLASCLVAFLEYFNQYPPHEDLIKPLMTNNGPAVEFSFALPIPGVFHPETHEPLLYAGRFDMLANFRDAVFVNDEKTCITGETWIHTNEGPRQVIELVGKEFTALVCGDEYKSTSEGFFKTGHKPVGKLITYEGYTLRLTAEHLVCRVTIEEQEEEYEWVMASNLVIGDYILIQDHRERPHWSGNYTEGEGYLIGALVGDGILSTRMATLCVWPGEVESHSFVPRSGVRGIMDEVINAAMLLPHRKHFKGWYKISGRGEYRLALASLRDLAFELGLRPGDKSVTPNIEKASTAFYIGFLRGFFDADGTVQSSHAAGVYISLAQSNLPRLEAVQRMLLRLGIVSIIRKNRVPRGLKLMPDGKGNLAPYQCSAQHKLDILKANITRFACLIGFADCDKAEKLKVLLESYKKPPNRERFIAKVSSIEFDSTVEVFDVSIPEINAFDANGFYIHNCSQLGPTWSAKWRLRAQLTGYYWAAKQFGYPVQGVIVRGICILKRDITHQMVIEQRPNWDLDRWLAQLIRDAKRMIRCWEEDYWDYNLDDTCNSYGGCPYTTLCTSPNPEQWEATHYTKSVWSPLHTPGDNT